MKVTKDKKLHVDYVQLKTGKVTRTVEFSPGLLVDFDKHGNVLGLEVLSLSKLAPVLKATGGNRKAPAA